MGSAMYNDGGGNLLVWRCGYRYMLGWFYVVIMTIHDILQVARVKLASQKGKIV